MTPRERQILAIIRNEPMVSQATLAERLGISRSAVAGHVMQLTAKGAIRGRGYVLADTPAVVCIGGANVDIQGRSTRSLRDGESNPGTISVSAGGVARNVAEHLVRGGVPCRLISAIGTDTNGRFLRDQIATAGLDSGDLLVVEGAVTPTYLSVLDKRGELAVAVNDMRVMDLLDAIVLSKRRALLEEARLLLADTNLSVEALRYLGDIGLSKPLFVDTVSQAKAVRIRAILGSIHTLKMNRTEAMAVSGISIRSRSQLGKLAGWFRERGVARVFITQGKDGVFFSADDDEGQVDAPEGGEVRAVTGAGDAFMAGLITGWLNGSNSRDSIALGQSLASTSLGHDAAVPPAAVGAGR